MMTVKMLMDRLAMFDQAAKVFVGGEDGFLVDVVQVDSDSIVLMGDMDDEDDEDQA